MSDLDPIFEAIKSGQCLPFLGAGASSSFCKGGQEVPGIPSGGKLSEIVARACKYPNGSTYDLARAAEYFIYSKSGRRGELESLISTEIAKVTAPRPIHTALAQIEFICFILTSNYDQLLESELQRYGRPLTKDFYNLQNPKTGHFAGSPFVEPPCVVLHKMHGTVEHPRSMVITQSDYIRYLAYLNDRDRGMPEFFRSTIIPNFTLLFLGYSLEDWNFRVIWEGILANYRDTGAELVSYALMKDPSNFDLAFWGKRNVSIINFDLTQFAVELARTFNLEIPQLDIAKVPPLPGETTT